MKTTTVKATTINSLSHHNYGGEIYPSDFDTSPGATARRQNGSFIASRIIQDARFDEQCLNNALIRDRIAAHNTQHHTATNHHIP